ncbi:MAG: nucleotide exchange factor GrpE [Candidatus Levybacteria bacterium]|nr:nucleotide exchange factor GrpE [Candidatus Levybacteria bacterium]
MKKDDKKNEQIENKELENLENQLKRALADYQNLEKRISDERQSFARVANKNLIAKLLPVLDTLFLAQKHIQDEGLDLSIRKFLDILAEEGVERMKTETEEFDPNTMECVRVAEGEEGKVLEEIRPGFSLNGEILRPAQVVVGKQTN